MEKLVALCYVWAFGLDDKTDYYTELDRLFLENPEDDFLLELEGLGDNRAEAWERLGRFGESVLNIDIFGKELFAALEKVYNANIFPLAEFGKRCYKLWCALPYEPFLYEHTEPFCILTYADDPLSYGEEGQSRDYYEAAFNYYKENP
ncbi:MAG: hypothetical protein HDT43_02085 [Ruminococcaceae bacterium]|nr:hypothetical protein [Oscillospiraceae bacterium]